MADGFRDLRQPDPLLGSERLVLRPWEPDDVGVLVAAWGDPDIARWTAVPDVADRVATARGWIARNPTMVEHNVSLDLAVEVDGDVVGEVGLVQRGPSSNGEVGVELGWWLLPSVRGRGLATEAVTLFSGFVVAPEGLGVGDAYAVCADGNPASGAVARRSGFVPCHRPAPAGCTTWRRVDDRSGGGTVPP